MPRLGLHAPLLLVLLGCALGACRAAPRAAEPGSPAARGRLIVCGRALPIDARVVTWLDPGGFDAYAPGAAEAGLRRGRTRLVEGERVQVVAPDERDPARLAPWVDQLVLHYDACGWSARCFRVLRERGLGVQLLLDVDGTLYQTMDLREEAWHATRANSRSLGVEIAHPGAFAPGDPAQERWYPSAAGGPRLALPAEAAAEIATPAFVPRPARAVPLEGSVNGTVLEQYDFTPEQERTLVALAAALARAFPRLALELPRDARGAVLEHALDDEQFARFRGILGHCHVQANKPDPGPAFPWERFLAEARLRALDP